MLLQQQLPPKPKPPTGRPSTANEPSTRKTAATTNQSVKEQTTSSAKKSVNSSGANGSSDHASMATKARTITGHCALIKSANAQNAAANLNRSASNVIAVQNANSVRHTLRLNGSTIALTKSGDLAAGSQLIITGSKLANGVATTNGTRPSNHIIINYSDLAKSGNGQVTLATASGKNFLLTSTPVKRTLVAAANGTTATTTTGSAANGGSSACSAPKRLKDSSGGISTSTSAMNGNRILSNILSSVRARTSAARERAARETLVRWAAAHRHRKKRVHTNG